MNVSKFMPVVAVAVLVLAAASMQMAPTVSAAGEDTVSIPATAAEHTEEAARYEREAQELDQKAQQHRDKARGYSARATGGSKQARSLRSLSSHCKRLARLYEDAAAEARAMAKSHREMAQEM